MRVRNIYFLRTLYIVLCTRQKFRDKIKKIDNISEACEYVTFLIFLSFEVKGVFILKVTS